LFINIFFPFDAVVGDGRGVEEDARRKKIKGGVVMGERGLQIYLFYVQ
jgi:hypothetical protein